MNKYSFQELTESKPREAYTQEQLKNIKLLSTGNKELATPFGSATYRVQPYPGDLDLHQIFTECCSVDEAVKKFEKIIKKIAKNIKSNKLHYFSEFKAGLDKRYDIDIGTIMHGIFNPKREEILEYSAMLFKSELLDKVEYNLINTLLTVPNPGGDEYDMLKYIFREHTVLRWSMDEVIHGSKMLPGNKVISLFDALTMQTHVKIDMITLVNDLIVEVTNFFILIVENEDGSHTTINLDYDYLDEKEVSRAYDKQLKDEIEKLYYSDMYYNPFKLSKRIWAYSRTFELEDSVRALTPLITGNVSYLYQIKSEIDTILRLFELKKYPIVTVDKQIDMIKQKLSNILFITEDELLVIYSFIDKFLRTKKNDKKEELLKLTKAYISTLINIRTIQGLDKIRYNPPPRKFLPSQLKYASKLRQPYEIVVNPLTKFIK